LPSRNSESAQADHAEDRAGPWSAGHLADSQHGLLTRQYPAERHARGTPCDYRKPGTSAWSLPGRGVAVTSCSTRMASRGLAPSWPAGPGYRSVRGVRRPAVHAALITGGDRSGWPTGLLEAPTADSVWRPGRQACRGIQAERRFCASLARYAGLSHLARLCRLPLALSRGWCSALAGMARSAGPVGMPEAASHHRGCRCHGYPSLG